MRDAWRVVKKRCSRNGGEDVGEDVSALQSHWRTDILDERCVFSVMRKGKVRRDRRT